MYGNNKQPLCPDHDTKIQLQERQYFINITLLFKQRVSVFNRTLLVVADLC